MYYINLIKFFFYKDAQMNCIWLYYVIFPKVLSQDIEQTVQNPHSDLGFL